MENSRDWTAELESRIVHRIHAWLHRLPSRPVDELMPVIMADVKGYGVLMARRGYVRGAIDETENETLSYREMLTAVAAPQAFPLPTRTRQVLREEPDPNGGMVMWRWKGRLEYWPAGGGVWIALVADNDSGRVFAPYPERIDLWHSLKHEPFRIEQVPADEGNPWPDEAL